MKWGLGGERLCDHVERWINKLMKKKINTQSLGTASLNQPKQQLYNFIQLVKV